MNDPQDYNWPEHYMKNPNGRTVNELKQACWWADKTIAVQHVRLDALGRQRVLLFLIGVGMGYLLAIGLMLL